jgi:hypothetical protein
MARRTLKLFAKQQKSLCAKNSEGDLEGVEEEQMTSHISNARRILQTLSGIKTSPQLNPAVTWLYVPFTVLETSSNKSL